MIICSETRSLEYTEFYNLEGYQIFYNESKINISDGVIMYIKKDIQHTVKIFEHENTKILTANIQTNNKNNLKILGLYRCHNLKSSNLINSLKVFLNQNKHINNHFILGDFNIDIINTSNDSENLLNNFSEFGFAPLIQSITRPNDRPDRQSLY